MFGLSPAQVINNFRWSCQGNNDEGSSDEGSSWIVQLNMFCNIESGMRLCNINESEALNSSHQHESIILSYQSSAPGIFALQDDWVCWALHCTLINTWNKELSEFFRKNFNLNIDDPLCFSLRNLSINWDLSNNFVIWSSLGSFREDSHYWFEM